MLVSSTSTTEVNLQQSRYILILKSIHSIQQRFTLFITDVETVLGDDETVLLVRKLKLKGASDAVLMGRDIFGSTGSSTS